MTRYATVDHLQALAVDLTVTLPSDEETQERLLSVAAADVDRYLGVSYEEAADYDALTEEQRAGLREATCAEAIWRNEMGPAAWLGIVDDVASAGSISFFRPSPALTYRYSPAMVEAVGGLGLSMRGGSLCAAPSSWQCDPEEEYAAPEPPDAA